MITHLNIVTWTQRKVW